MIRIGRWTFDPATRRVVAGSQERRLSPKAAGVLKALSETPRRIWSRDALLERVWPAVYVGEEVLTHAIAELRRALGDDFRRPRFVETVHKSGYRLLCTVAQIAQDGVEIGCCGEEEDAEPSGAFGLDDYVAYLDACALFERGGRGNTDAAIAVFGRVLTANPEFALAHAGMAKALTFMGTYYEPNQASLELALDHCATARRIAPRAAGAYAAEGLVFAIGGQFDRALGRFRRSIELEPESSDSHYLLGRACFAELNVRLAAPILERAAALRSEDYHALLLAGKARQILGDAPQARADFALALSRIEPMLAAYPNDYRALCDKARCLVQLGRGEEARIIMEEISRHPDPMNYYLACTYARAGESDRALDTLEQVIELGWRHRAWLDRDPDFDGLRGDTRFRRLASSIRTAA